MFLVNIFVRLEQNITQISRLRRSAALRRTAKNDLPKAKSQSERRRKNDLYILHEARRNSGRIKKTVRGLRNRGSQPRRKNPAELFGSVLRSGKSGKLGDAVQRRRIVPESSPGRGGRCAGVLTPARTFFCTPRSAKAQKRKRSAEIGENRGKAAIYTVIKHIMHDNIQDNICVTVYERNRKCKN